MKIAILLAGQVPDECAIEFQFDDGLKSMKDIVHGGSGAFQLAVPNPKIWSPDSPNIHLLTVSISGCRRECRFGLRTIEARDGALFLNGEELRLFGFNRHDAHPDFGYAVPDPIRLADLQLMKQTGCNIVRGSHYPQSEDFLNLCDQIGMLVWEESLAWGNTIFNLVDPTFRRRQIEQTGKMVQKSINHPCVILWGFLNEVATNVPEAREIVSNLVSVIRNIDDSRPITFATCHGTADLCLDCVDVIAFNTYPGWYGSGTGQFMERDVVRRELRELETFASSEKYRDKPLILSEIGAEGIPGDHSGLRWSEEYQTELAETVIGEMEQRKRWSGVIFWLFCDTRSHIAAWSRPRGFNGKGFLDEYRRPKQTWLALLKTQIVPKS